VQGPSTEEAESPEIGASLTTPELWVRRSRKRCHTDVRQPTLTKVWEIRDPTGLVREPDAGNLHVRFDERGVETEHDHPMMPPRHTSTLRFTGMTRSLASRGCRTHASTRAFTLPGFLDTRCRHPPGS